MKSCNDNALSFEQMPLADLLLRLEQELRTLADDADKLQSSVSTNLTGDVLQLTGDVSQWKQRSADMQSLDKINQTLVDLAVFTKFVASATPENYQIKSGFSQSIFMLEDLAKRLAGLSSEAQSAKAELGECELF